MHGGDKDQWCEKRKWTTLVLTKVKKRRVERRGEKEIQVRSAIKKQTPNVGDLLAGRMPSLDAAGSSSGGRILGGDFMSGSLQETKKRRLPGCAGREVSTE